MMKIADYISECKRCGKLRSGYYVYDFRWTTPEGKPLGSHPTCVWHDVIVNGKSDLK